jgi:2-polyprenyl-3-methyl-5-hydroxy-6-metoxy-1,4-benzoquinol methylase
VGAGHGRYSIPFAEQGHQVTATDVSEEMLKLLMKNKGQLPINTVAADAHHLPFPDGAFDVIFSNDFLCHFPNWALLLQEKARLCRPGGQIITSFCMRDHEEFTRTLPEVKPYVSAYSSEPGDSRPFWASAKAAEFKTVCEQAGLTIKQMQPLKFFHDSYLFGRLLGEADFLPFKEEFNRRLDASAEVQEFYNWLEMNMLQKLPFQMTNLTLVVLEKAA